MNQKRVKNKSELTEKMFNKGYKTTYDFTKIIYELLEMTLEM